MAYSTSGQREMYCGVCLPAHVLWTCAHELSVCRQERAVARLGYFLRGLQSGCECRPCPRSTGSSYSFYKSIDNFLQQWTMSHRRARGHGF